MCNYLAYGQESTSSVRYQTLKKQDSLLFDIGFNTCDISQFENLLSADFEFYHDQGGITSSKNDFIGSIRNNICLNSKTHKVRRELEEGIMEVYPLKKNGVIYSAIQSGIHRFYMLEPGKPVFYKPAKFTHVWQLEKGEWKFLRGLSYDHQETDSSSPIFEDQKKWNPG